MSAIARPLEDIVRELPPGLRKELRDFAEFLLSKRGERSGEVLRQDWAGALCEHRAEYTSLELQRLALHYSGEATDPPR